MTVTTRELPEYKDIRLEFKKNKYPLPGDINLPRLYFVGLFVGSRGSGKTFKIVELLKMYEKYGIYDPDTKKRIAQRIVIFSPTHDANPVFTCLKHLDDTDVIASYSDAKLLEVVKNVKMEREQTKKYQAEMSVYHKFRRCKSVDELEPHELFKLHMTDFEPPVPPRYPNGVVTHFIFDDLIGSSAFRAVGKSALTSLVLRNRHIGINILIATQNLKAIPKGIRSNASLMVLFRFASMKVILEDLYEEVSSSLTIAQFEELYAFATHEENSAFVIDFSQPRTERFKRNWSDVLTLK